MKQRAERIISTLILFLGIIGISTTQTSYAAPNLVNYQGVLEDSGGTPVPDANYAMTFRVYDALTAGTLLWEEDQAVVTVNGIYNVLLGSGTPIFGSFDPALFSNNNLWLEVEVSTEVLTPRQQVTSVAFALQAQEATHAVTADDADTVDGAHVAALEESSEIDADILAHAGDASAHHTKTTSFTDLADQAVDAQIPAVIARDSEIMPTVLAGDGSGSTLDADTVDGLDSTAFMSSGTDNWVDETGDTMTGVLNLPTNGFVAGTDQLVLSGGNVGIGTTNPDSPLTLAGGIWNLDTTEGDFKIGNSSVRLKIGTALGGGGQGIMRIRAHGGTSEQLRLGTGTGGDVVTIKSGNVGIGTTNPLAVLHVDVGTGTSVYGTSTSGIGVVGYSAGTSGEGVRGVTSSSTGTTYGVKGTSASSGGVGVYGKNTSSGNLGYIGSSNYGVYGGSSSPGSYGVKGESSSSSGGIGVYGKSSNSTGTTHGVYGVSASSSGKGVYGYNSSTTNYGYIGGGTIGVYGNSTSGEGVRGKHATSGNYGYLGGGTIGVYGYSSSYNGYGVYGRSSTSNGYGVYGYNSASGNYGILASNGYAGYFGGDVYVTGNMAGGGLKWFIQPHAKDPAKEIVYVAAEGPEAMIFIRGTAQLKDGSAVIDLPEYFSIVAAEQGVKVQVTSHSADTYGLAVVERSRERIVVKEFRNGQGNFTFDYFITAVRAGFEEHKPIVANTHFKPQSGETAEEFEIRYSKGDMTTRAIRAMLISNGILTEDGTLNMAKVEALGWTFAEQDSAPKLEFKAGLDRE